MLLNFLLVIIKTVILNNSEPNNSFKLVFIYLLQITIYAEFELTHSSSRPFHSIEKYQITVTIMVSLIPADL